MIPAVLPNIGLFDVEDAPRRYRIRLMGTQIVTWYGCDITGRYLDEIDFGGRTGFTFSLLDQVVDRCVPGHMTGDYTKQDARSEEHTSELQSLMRTSYAVFCLKNKNTSDRWKKRRNQTK